VRSDLSFNGQSRSGSHQSKRQPETKYQSEPKIQKGFWIFTSFLLLNFSSLVTEAASAQTPRLGVVKSPENAMQWEGITTRLQAAGVAYCVVDLSQVDEVKDLTGTRVIFLPNIETLTPAQVTALQRWSRKGGRVIASGPVGSLSSPEVKSSLRSLLGAYWGFALTNPSTLEPLQTQKPTAWIQQNGLTGTVRGGVMIPASSTSRTAAIWTSDPKERSAAVITTQQSVSFGWRWGVDAVAPIELDTAWLRAALNRYQLASSDTPSLDASQSACLPATTQTASASSLAGTANETPLSLPWVQRKDTAPVSLPWVQTPASEPSELGNPSAMSRPNRENSRSQRPLQSPPPSQRSLAQVEDAPVAPAGLDVKPGSQPLKGLQVNAMREELENLIGRYESALLAEAAANSNNALQPAAPSSTLLPARQENKVADKPAVPSTVTPTAKIATNAIAAEAKSGLRNFLQLVAKQDYSAARSQWFQTRRILWDNYPTNHKSTHPEIRAIWLDRGSIVNARSETDLAKIFDQLAQAGINTVFFETLNAGYPIYPSRIAPTQNPLVQGWDPLKAAVQLAHERGMELHAWVWVFAAGNQRHNSLLNLPANYPGPVLAAHPDWAMYDNQGSLFDPRSGKVFLDPANEEVRRYLMDLFDEIASNYEVDGIQFDYIRYPFQDPAANQTYGYGKAARQQFRALAGVDPLRISPRSREQWQKWTQFRTQQIDSFVATAAQRLRAKRPELIVSAAVFPFPQSERLEKLQQNWEDWAQRGDVDLLVPMTYALDTNRLQQIAQVLFSGSRLSSTLMVPGIRLLNLSDVVAIDQIQLLRDSPVSGYSLFAFENLNPNLQTIFSRTQGTLTPKVSASLPYRQPFEAAAVRYTALQREWQLLSTNNQMWIREPALTEWRQQAENLSKELNQLAAEPSNNHLFSAKASLRSFRTQFSKWMQLHAVEQPYQVQVWENRLATVERLLLYGERTVLNRKNRSVAEVNREQ